MWSRERWRSAVVGISVLWIEKHEDASALCRSCVLHILCTGYLWSIQTPSETQLPNKNDTCVINMKKHREDHRVPVL